MSAKRKASDSPRAVVTETAGAQSSSGASTELDTLIADLSADDHFAEDSRVVAAVRALADRTNGDAACALEAGSKGAIAPLVALLEHKEANDEWSYNLKAPEVQMNAARALGHLAAFRSHALAAVKQQVLPRLVGLTLSDPSTVPPQVREASLDALRALAVHSDIKAQIIKFGVDKKALRGTGGTPGVLSRGLSTPSDAFGASAPPYLIHERKTRSSSSFETFKKSIRDAFSLEKGKKKAKRTQIGGDTTGSTLSKSVDRSNRTPPPTKRPEPEDNPLRRSQYAAPARLIAREVSTPSLTGSHRRRQMRDSSSVPATPIQVASPETSDTTSDEEEPPQSLHTRKRSLTDAENKATARSIRRSSDALVLPSNLEDVARRLDFPPDRTIAPRKKGRRSRRPEPGAMSLERERGGSSVGRTSGPPSPKVTPKGSRRRRGSPERSMSDGADVLLIKCHWDDDLRLLAVPATLSQQELLERVALEYERRPSMLKFYDDQGDLITISKDLDVRVCFSLSPVRLYAFPSGSPANSAATTPRVEEEMTLATSAPPALPSLPQLPWPTEPERLLRTMTGEEDASAQYPWLIGHDELEVLPQASLGRGYFGEVKKALWRGSVVAAKVIYRQRFRERNDLELFAREIHVLSKLRHPKVILFLGACVDPASGDKVIVMEYMERGSLHDVLHGRRELHPRTAHRIATDIALGMNYLHGEHILHRDLNCKNILLDGNFTAKVSDFGLSRIKEQTDASISNTMGAVAWMAPEIIEDPRSFTYGADVYSYAMVLYELFTRRSPLPPDMAPMQLARKVTHENYRPELPPSVREPYQKLITAAWATDHDARPSFLEVLVLLRAVKRTLPALEASPWLTQEDSSSTSESNLDAKLIEEFEAQARVHGGLRHTPIAQTLSEGDERPVKRPPPLPPVLTKSNKSTISTDTLGTESEVDEGDKGGDYVEEESL